jgi:prepilin-type N-terminal cleavage/methylation domain-containing protein
MNNYYLNVSKYMASLKTDREKGFTLIELLVVVILMGLMAALAMPILIKQVEKARQAEARSALGAINRTQQAYRQEAATFGSLSQLPITLPPTNFYTFSDDLSAYAIADPEGSAQRAVAVTIYDNDVRNYASAVGQTPAGVYSAIVCEALDPYNDSATTSNSSGVISCVNSRQLR